MQPDTLEGGDGTDVCLDEGDPAADCESVPQPLDATHLSRLLEANREMHPGLSG
jgi:hypothetical protein